MIVHTDLRKSLDRQLRQQCLRPWIERVDAALKATAAGKADPTELRNIAQAIAEAMRLEPAAHLGWWFPEPVGDYRPLHALNLARLGALVAHTQGHDAAHFALLGLTCDVGMWLPAAGPVLHDKPLDTAGAERIVLLPTLGAHCLAPLGESIQRVAREHHERADGTGYPDSLPRNRLHQHSVLFQIIDSFLGQVEPRAFRPRRNPPDAMGRLLLQAERGHYDLPAFRAFANALGFYPLGTVVRLNTGETAQITALNDLDPKRPEVSLLSDADGMPRLHPVVVKLASRPTLEITDAI